MVQTTVWIKKDQSRATMQMIKDRPWIATAISTVEFDQNTFHPMKSATQYY